MLPVYPSVLVIEDEADIRELVRVNLELEGYSVLLAPDGPSGLAAANQHHPGVVILDVMLPGFDGWEVLARLKGSSDPEVANVPVVMLTARSSQLDRLRGGIEGAIRYLTKPFSPAQLRQEVRDALASPQPEAVRRRAVQQESLLTLARLEAGAPVETNDAPRPRLARLEHRRFPTGVPEPTPPPPALPMSELTVRQRAMIEAISRADTVSDAAALLGVSRSNVYAGLRRIARNLGVASVTEIVRRARAGGLG